METEKHIQAIPQGDLLAKDCLAEHPLFHFSWIESRNL